MIKDITFSYTCSYRSEVITFEVITSDACHGRPPLKGMISIRHVIMTFWTYWTSSTSEPLLVEYIVSCPDPALWRGKGSGDYWAISWVCWVNNSLDFGQSNEILSKHGHKPM